MKWDRLRLFNIVVQTGNITHASSILNISQPALSRQIKSLEDEIGVQLFVRNTDGLTLTKAGINLSKSVYSVANEIEKVQNNLFANEDIPKGKLRVTATNAFGALWVAPKMSKFVFSIVLAANVVRRQLTINHPNHPQIILIALNA